LATILSGIHSLEQHLSRWQSTPNDYRPARCPDCGKAGLWCHGCYGRKSDRQNPSEHSLNLVPIPRFRCRHCRRTCSTLPECVPPRRWYLWQVQQAALVLMLSASSLLAASTQLVPSRKTLRRWRLQLKARFEEHAFCLRGRSPELGRATGFASFWQACLERIPLSRAMIWVQQHGVVMP
jgi:Domain of unknown function (DUF6431)